MTQTAATLFSMVDEKQRKRRASFFISLTARLLVKRSDFVELVIQAMQPSNKQCQERQLQHSSEPDHFNTVD